MYIIKMLDLYFVYLFLENYNEAFFTSNSPRVLEFLDSSKIKAFGIYFIFLLFLALSGMYSI